MLLCSENSDIICMDVINAEWIKARMTGKRGEQARIAEAMGIDGDKISKVLKGNRQVQPEEIPGLLKYFNETLSGVEDDLLKELEDKIRLLPKERLPEARQHLEYLLSLSDPEENPES